MTQHSRTARSEQPHLFRKVMRNHFDSGDEAALYDAHSGFTQTDGVTPIRSPKPLSASMWAAQRQITYRFGWINAVFNPVKVLLGDDPNCLTDDERGREWL